MRWARAVVAAVAAGALAAPAAAWVRTASDETGAALFWPAPVVPWFLSSAPSSPTPSCAGAGEPFVDAVRASFAQWEQGCSGLDLVYGGRIGESRTGLGGTAENVVVMRDGWCSQHEDARSDPCMTDPDLDCGGIYNCYEDHGDRTTVALTIVLYDPDTGRIFDADVQLNGWDGRLAGVPVSAATATYGYYFTCDHQPGRPECTFGEGGCNGYDLRNTMTHEVGHVLGLAHPCETVDGTCSLPLPPGESIPYAQRTMYPSTGVGETSKRDLSDDDVAGVCAAYPQPGGCGSAGGAGALGTLLAAGGALSLRAGIRRRARPRSRRPGACRR